MAHMSLAWPCALSPDAPKRAHSAYLRAVVAALGPHAGSAEWDDSLAGTGPDGEEIMLLEAFVDVAGGIWTLVWNQMAGWSYSIAPLDDEDDEPKERLPLITGAIVPPADAVALAVRTLAERGPTALPAHADEIPIPVGAQVGVEQREFMELGYITPDTAQRLAVYSLAEDLLRT
ncbi:DUF6292 family protein [Streptomyces rubradiris]|uniref:DUF6292 domain-containing protein n=2 Tax=Streptomyces rubradiris TaxID=285531 RepID=A0ABQ3RAC1_STRRR|nr:DUF6292 family protein [Streptomyces rubradiris]GHH25979.1 hypothetical protein GCM10018792_65830 [Streptomyces rubradiris]GHI52788.1 hypothetical protein Srubr_26340 [Streptomyces rubradiris]